MLVTEYELLGMQAWLEAYHGTSCGTKGIICLLFLSFNIFAYCYL